MKEKKIKKEYLNQTRKLIETKLYCRNLIKGINTWAVPLVRYPGPFLKCRTSTNGPEDKKANGALHQKDDIDRLFVSRKGGGRLASIEDSVDASIWGLEDNIKKSKERLITATIKNTDNIKINRTTITRKQKWEEKQLYGYFKRQTNENSHEKTWTWLKKASLKRQRGFLLLATKKRHKDQLY